jgi:hypothetical protein
MINFLYIIELPNFYLKYGFGCWNQFPSQVKASILGSIDRCSPSLKTSEVTQDTTYKSRQKPSARVNTKKKLIRYTLHQWT